MTMFTKIVSLGGSFYNCRFHVSLLYSPWYLLLVLSQVRQLCSFNDWLWLSTDTFWQDVLSNCHLFDLGRKTKKTVFLFSIISLENKQKIQFSLAINVGIIWFISVFIFAKLWFLILDWNVFISGDLRYITW